ncbi:hypothetical protein [Rheinheimera sp.]|uniref:hypothetical protein n=1 Tax=Rheinheimera sp. TaxID=1869214 RepID=UPI00307EF999
MSRRIEQLASQVTQLLGPEAWGIGGSFLLYCHGLLQQAQDLDLVCTPEFFPEARQLLLRLGDELNVEPHPCYCSQHFCRIQTALGVIELMAGIQVMQNNHLHSFSFRPDQIQWQHSYPLMSLQDWLHLYRLFNRPHRVQQLEAFFKGHADV